jgi:hypothetical protein
LTRRPTTVADYRSKIRTRSKPAIGSIRLGRLTPRRLDAAYGVWLADGLSPTTVHHLATLIGTALNQAVKWVPKSLPTR